MASNRTLIIKVVGDTKSVIKAFKSAGKSADTFHGKVTNAAKGITKGFAVAGVAIAGIAVALGTKAVSAAANFEKSMSRVVGLAGQSRKQVAKWSDQLIGLGPALAKSPQELAEALYFIASSGVPASKALSVLTASAKASTAGLGETEVVADAVTSVMNAYAGAGMTAARATDVLVATVREGKGEADAFAGVIGNVAAFASRLKVPFEQVGAALAAMTQLGTDPRTAATQLQAFFSQVAKPSKKALDAAESVGYSFDRLRVLLAKGDLIGALNHIKEGFRGNAFAMAAVFPNIRALRALLALTADDGGKVAGVFARMSDSSGSLKKAFAAASKESSTNIDRFKASLSALQIAFGQGLLPMVNKVAIALGKKLMNPAFVQRVRQLGLMIGTGLYNAFQKVWTWFSENWPAIVRGFNTAVNIAQQVAAAVSKIADAIMRVVDAGKQVDEFTKKIPGSEGKGLLGTIGKVLVTNPLLETGYAAPGEILGPKKKAKPGGGKIPFTHRQHGGRVMRGATYTVGEHGPERFTAPASGRITANGGGGMHFHGPIYVTAGNVRQLMGELERYAKTHAGQTRGRFGGSKLALG